MPIQTAIAPAVGLRLTAAWIALFGYGLGSRIMIAF
jgi:hypothetical protein